MIVDLFDQYNKKTGDLVISDTIFNEVFKEKPLSYYVYAYLSNQRQNNAKTKDRSEVSGGGRKPYSQKGTGRARAGSIRSPLWRKGGVTFGPTNLVNRKKHVNKKLRKLVFRIVFSYLLRNHKLKFVDKFNISEPSTKEANKIMEAFEHPKKLLIITNEKNDNVIKSFRNLVNVNVSHITEVNPYLLLQHNLVLLEKESLEYINSKWDVK
ncbi:MAG: 50S ribosomal protein L4 [Candidatus Dojkabacteria bacterium]|nr:50S ribosomal protein L4 [Candidatus Dojkabacteria bacterium]